MKGTESNTQLMLQLLAGQTSCLDQLALLNSSLPQPTDTLPAMLPAHPDYVTEPARQLEELETRLEAMGSQLETLSGKMDLILTKLIRGYINN